MYPNNCSALQNGHSYVQLILDKSNYIGHGGCIWPDCQSVPIIHANTLIIHPISQGRIISGDPSPITLCGRSVVNTTCMWHASSVTQSSSSSISSRIVTVQIWWQLKLLITEILSGSKFQIPTSKFPSTLSDEILKATGHTNQVNTSR